LVTLEWATNITQDSQLPDWTITSFDVDFGAHID
jgi:hypothetical protein